jgi:hypothetical protein
VFSVKGTGAPVLPLAHFSVSCRLDGLVDGLMIDGGGGGRCLLAVSVLGSAIKGDGAGIRVIDLLFLVVRVLSGGVIEPPSGAARSSRLAQNCLRWCVGVTRVVEWRAKGRGGGGEEHVGPRVHVARGISTPCSPLLLLSTVADMLQDGLRISERIRILPKKFTYFFRKQYHLFVQRGSDQFAPKIKYTLLGKKKSDGKANYGKREYV